MKQIAIFGGTFNPPHNGHVEMVKQVLNLNGIDRVLVMPSKIPPHKSGNIVSAEDRAAMCQLAFGDIEGAEICLDELKLSGKSYTYNTLKHFAERGVKNPILIIGGDSLITLNKWYKFADILNMAEFYVYYRENISKDSVMTAKKELEKIGGKISIINICPPNISSTEIREKVERNQDVENLVSAKVLEYIKAKKLYVRDKDGTCI